MSASPSQPASAPGSTPSGTAASAPRKRPPPDIFTKKKKPVRKPAPAQTTAVNRPQPNGSSIPQHAQTTNGPPPVAQPEERAYNDYAIYVSKDASMQGLHYHAMKLNPPKDAKGNQVIVNPFEEAQFTRPLRLHRRNARDKMETADMSDAASGVDDKEKEMMSIRRAERQAEREANQALIAPTGGDSKKVVKKKPQKKVEDVYFDENNPQQRQRAQLRYEEARPWHLEDFEGKKVWVGSYQEPLSETCVMFELGDSGFRMIPVEKWYRFIQTNRVQVMDSDQAEKHMAMKQKAPRWFLGTQQANDEQRRQQAARQRSEQQRAQQRRFDDDDDAMVKREEYNADVDEIDFEFDDEFQDDDEGIVFGEIEDDETKETSKRIRDEQRTANLAGTGVKDEDRDWDEEEQQEKKAEQEEKRRTKRMRKQLSKKERKQEYESNSDHGEFSESSESEDSEEERERLEEERKQEEAKKLNGEKSGASTKGTNTPTGRAEKKDSKTLGASLKRPGSPDLSELSGNESSRKKVKSLNGRAVSTSAPNGARSLSPDSAKPRTGTGGYGSGSDTDTSRTGRPKIRLKNSNSPTGTPSASGSRAQSPQRKTPSFPTLDEVQSAIPPGGVAIGQLAQLFKPRVINRQAEFIALVKQAGKQDAHTKKIMPKPAGAQSPGDATQ